jgi:hypothetical protein
VGSATGAFMDTSRKQEAGSRKQEAGRRGKRDEELD